MLINVYRGDNLHVKGIVRNQDGEPVDITGSTIKFSVKKRQTDVAFILSVDCSIDVPLEGKFEVSLSPHQTNIPIGSYFYDIQLRFPLGETYTLAKDNFVVLRDITV